MMGRGVLIMFLCWLIISPLATVAQSSVDFYISNKGNDNNPGNQPLLPRKTLTGISIGAMLNRYREKGNVQLKLKSGDSFNENFLPPCPVQLGTYPDSSGSTALAVMDGSKEVTGWVKEPGLNYTWQQAVPYTGFTGYGINGVGSYSYMYVIEIDKALEKTAPYSARKLLTFLADPAAVENTPGSFYTPVNTTDNPRPFYIHTSDGGSPNDHPAYRYEVTVRDWAVNSTFQANNRFENLWVRGFGAGNGMIPSGDNAYYNRMVFGPGAAIHHLVVRSGTIDHSLFLPGPKNTNAFAIVFYDLEGSGRHCTIKNSMFFDIPEPVYTHTSGGVNYGAVEIDRVLAFAPGEAANGFMYTFNNDSILLNKVYTDGYKSGYNYANATWSAITNCWFKEVSFGIGYSAKFPVKAVVKNVFIKTTGTAFTTGIFMQSNTSLTLANSVIHVVNTNQVVNGVRAGSFVFGGGSDTGRIAATGNIFVCDIDPSKSLTAATVNTDKGIATSKDYWDNNVYILLRGKSIVWTATNPATNGGSPNIQSFSEWKRQSGQDQHSLFFDLRNDPRGLKAIFADPGNGNYDLANTAEGNQVAALRAGMTEPITCFLQRPTYEEAAALVTGNQLLSVNSCRNPCSQNRIRVAARFDTSLVQQRQVTLSWNISEQQNIDHYELQRSLENPNFETIETRFVTADTAYSFTDQVQPGMEYRYRLLVKAKGAGECYSPVLPVKITGSSPVTIYPNPSTGKILISLDGYLGNTKLLVSNAMGQVIASREAYSWYAPLQIDCSNQPKGMYWLKITTASGTTIKKFLLQ